MGFDVQQNALVAVISVSRTSNPSEMIGIMNFKGSRGNANNNPPANSIMHTSISVLTESKSSDTASHFDYGAGAIIPYVVEEVDKIVHADSYQNQGTRIRRVIVQRCV